MTITAAKPARFLFTILCFSLALYMVITLLMKFLRNEDSSSIEIRKFNILSRDMYPTFTICLISMKGGIFSDRYLDEGFGLNGLKYQQALLGTEKYCKWGINFTLGRLTLQCKKTNLRPSNISNIRFEEATTKLQDFMNRYVLMDNPISGNNVRKWTATENQSEVKDNQPLYRSYQDASTICFTRKTKFDYGLIQKRESIALNLTYLTGQKDIRLWISTHHPGQTVRGFSEQTYFAPTDVMEKMGNIRNTFTLSQVIVLRRRPDANDPCNPKPNDDELFKKAAIKEIGCIPPYWQEGGPSDLKSLPNCSVPSQLAKMNSAILNNSTDFLASYEHPCDEMSMNNNMIEYKTGNARSGGQTWEIWFNFPSERYQEIQNKRDFGYDSFGSNVGGYVGIFLGFGLLQLPDLVIGAYALLKSKL